MALTVEQLFLEKLDTTREFTAAAAEAIADITTNSPPIGYSTLGIDPNWFTANYSAVPDDTTPMPVYQAPAIAQPATPVLGELNNISSPVLPTKPTLSTSGLFNHNMPSSNIPDFTGQEPQLHANEIYNAIAAVMQPVLEEVNLPEITPLNIRAIPKVTLPGYVSQALPQELADPADYAAYFKQQYSERLPAVNGLAKDMVDAWIGQHAPDYYNVRDQLSQAVQLGLSGNALPVAHEAALYSRQQARIQRESSRAELDILNSPAQRGWIVPPGAVQSALDKLQVESVRSLAGSSTDVYIEIRRAAIQSYQFILSMADNQVNTVRAMVGQWFDRALALDAQVVAQAKTLADLLMARFEHDRSRAEFSLALMKAAYEKFEAELKIAMADLDIFKVELSALEVEKNVELKLLDAAKIKLDAQELKVRLYSAIVDAIAKRAVGDELLVKQFETKAKVFDTQIKAVLASFDAYEAAMNGDKAKLDGELAKLDVYKAELQGANLKLDADKSLLEGQIASNDAKLKQFGLQLGNIETSAKIALQRFTAEAEIKKLGLDVYKTKVGANIDVFRGNLQKDIAINGAITEAFRGNVASLNNFYQLQIEKSRLKQVGTIAIAEGYSNMASAAQQASSGVLSFAANA